VCTIFHSAGIRKYRVKPAVGHKIIQLTTQSKYNGKFLPLPRVYAPRYEYSKRKEGKSQAF
jgi:hypothetical protein